MTTTKPNKKLIAKVQKLCQKFHDDLQALFDSPEMNDATYDSEVCQAACEAQASAADAVISP